MGQSYQLSWDMGAGKGPGTVHRLYFGAQQYGRQQSSWKSLLERLPAARPPSG